MTTSAITTPRAADPRRLTARDFQAALAALATDLRQHIDTDCPEFPNDPAASAARARRARDDFRFFCVTYFPHYLSAPPSLLHDFLFEALPALIADPRGRHLALAAPRGEAKSTLAALLFPLWAAVTGRKHYLILIMDTLDQALPALESIKAELDSNPRLRRDFPEQCGEGRIWTQRVILTANNVKIEVFGSSKRLRGLRHGPHRPDLIVLDDIENDENVRSPAQRDKLERWLSKSVLPLGAADGRADVFVIGTVLHYDAVLSRLLQKPLWESHRFRALLRWPDRMDLWERWEEILRNEGEEAADRYYLDSQIAMDAGAQVSWPAQRPLVALMKLRARDGHATFDSELQNDPVNEGESWFGRLQFWAQRNPNWIYFGACDPSLGKAGAGRDPSAVLIGGYDRASGVLDVIEARILRRLPSLLIEDIVNLQRLYGCLGWAIEAVQFQEFFRTELIQRSAARGIPVPARPVVPHHDKQLRIESLQPHVENGLIRVHASQGTLIQQLRHYPHADHDDGPDALHMLWTLALTMGRGALRPLGMQVPSL